MKANKERMVVECKEQGVDHIYQLRDNKAAIVEKVCALDCSMEEREVFLKVIRQLVKQNSSNGSKRDGFNADKRREGEREREGT